MKRSRIIILVALIVEMMLCLSCGNQSKERLDNIDSLIYVDADSAVLQLKLMKDEMSDASDEVRNYYNLLCVKADDKAKVKHTSDSLILSVAQFYEQMGDADHLPEVYYYVGRTYSDIRESEKAMYYYHKSLQCDSTKVSDYLKGRVYFQMGYIYKRNRLYDEARSMKEFAYFYFKNIGDTLAMRYCKEDIKNIETLASDSTLDEVERRTILLKLQKINEKVKNGKLMQMNSVLEAESSKEKRMLTIISSVAVLAVLLIACLIYLKRRRTENGHATDSSAPVKSNNTELTTPAKRQFYDKEVSELLNKHVNSGKVLKPNEWQMIEERLLVSFPSFKDDLYSVYELSETEYHVCILIKCETSPSKMAKLLSISSSSITQIRTRLQHKVFNGAGTAKDWDNYVLSL